MRLHNISYANTILFRGSEAKTKPTNAQSPVSADVKPEVQIQQPLKKDTVQLSGDKQPQVTQDATKTPDCKCCCECK